MGGTETLYGKCYLCSKPGYSEAASNRDGIISALMEFSVRLSSIANTSVLSRDQDSSNLERLRTVYVSTLRN